MPIYPYKCEECGHEFEVIFLSIDEYDEFTPDPCHKCEGDVKRMLTMPNVKTPVRLGPEDYGGGAEKTERKMREGTPVENIKLGGNKNNG